MMEKQVRPRRYRYAACNNMAHPVVAHLVAALDELTDRHIDVLQGLPANVLNARPEGTPFSIAMITAHLCQCELYWLKAVADAAPPRDLVASLSAVRKGPVSPCGAYKLRELCQRVRSSTTKPALAPVTDVDAERDVNGRILSVRGVLMHLVWHWTYHNGQCGLLRMQAGHDYDWSFDGWITGGEKWSASP